MSFDDLASFSKGELARLATTEWLGTVTRSMTETIERSFAEDLVLRPVKTRNEVKRRFKICMMWFVRLRRDLNWSIPRILDALPRALRHELDGTPFDPEAESKRIGWAGNEPPSPLLIPG